MSSKRLGTKEMYDREIMIPVPNVTYTNLDPNMLLHKECLTSSDRRINQGAELVNDNPQGRISETRDSQQKVMDLIPDFRKIEQETTHRRKRRVSGSSRDASCYPAFLNKSPPTFPSSTYRNIMQAADLKNQEMKGVSVTTTDFVPKILNPLSNPPIAFPRSFEPKSPPWMQYRKVRSRFIDQDVPKRYGYYKFLDDEKPSW